MRRSVPPLGGAAHLAVAESLYAEFKEPLYAPPPLLCRMVQAGQLGRKTGHGFYRHTPTAASGGS